VYTKGLTKLARFVHTLRVVKRSKTENKPVKHKALVASGRKKSVFTLAELARLTGASRRQISYWESIGLLTAKFSDVRQSSEKAASYFPRAEALKALVFCELKAKGFSLHQIKQVGKNLTNLNLKLETPGSFILSDGFSVYFAANESQVIDILRHARQMTLIPIQDQLEKLQFAA
jgi:DNA-binding transcriptional MerR regulator